MKSKNDHQFAFRIPSDVWSAILKKAEEEALTPSAILRQLLIKAVRDWEKTQIERKGPESHEE
ncbi:hypothetical protein [Anaerolinea sp.]|uniref:hypothetical protein n=1 Tax=Anaerolinea sp. TaxID=1872519 RepID=UPI002ACEF055|nr:hypothetical protein [Anaerolinea sp.]